MPDYEAKALEEAHGSSLTSMIVWAMDSVAIGGLAGVKRDSEGDSPADFFYENVRRKVANDLEGEEFALVQAANEVTLADLLARAPSLSNFTVRRDERGRMVVVE